MFCDDSRVVDEKERDGDGNENNVEDYERRCEIRGTACLIRLGRRRVGVIKRWIGTRTW